MKQLLAIALLLIGSTAYAGQLHIAVATSLKPSFEQLAAAFTEAGGAAITISSGSSGQLFAQIQQGANYDIFFSADAERPQALAKAQPELGPSDNFAYGQLALYSRAKINCDQWQDVLAKAEPRNIALANPKLAPYGMAAQQVLTSITKSTRGMPLASNAAIPLNWLYSGSVNYALTAYSFANTLDSNTTVCPLPAPLYTPIEHHYLALKNTANSVAFITFVNSPKAQLLLHKNGYIMPVHD